MSADYLINLGLKRINKRYTAESGARTAFWTPAASARIILTDMVVSTSLATTFRIEFGTSNGFVIMDHFCAGSSTVYPLCDSPVYSEAMDCPLVVSFGTAQSNGSSFVSAQGFEDRP
jgi:hypothetical protein